MSEFTLALSIYPCIHYINIIISSHLTPRNTNNPFKIEGN